MSHVIIVWQTIPEGITVYSVKVDPAMAYLICKCHGHYINTCDLPEDVEAALMKVSEWLETQKDKIIYNDLGDDRIGTEQAIIVDIGRIVVSGFVC